MSDNSLSFSRFTHSFERGGVVALFHSLKMEPVFLDVTLTDRVNVILKSSSAYSEDDFDSLQEYDIFIKTVDSLLNNRVLNETAGRDDDVITHFRKSIQFYKIQIAYFILAENCNLCCSYCFERIHDRWPSNVLMSQETALKSIDFFERQLMLYPSEKSEKFIIFYGGEPLLNYHTLIFTLKNIQQRKKENPELWNNTKLSMVTNGTLLTEEWLIELNSYELEISISIDGPEHITNVNRYYFDNRGVFEDAMRAIQLCKDNNVSFGLSVTLSEIAVEHQDELLQFLDKIAPNSIGFNILMGKSNAEYDKKATLLLIEAFKKFRQTGMFEDRMMRKVKAFIRHQVYPFDCGATGGNQLIFAPGGQVGICHGYLAEKKYFPTNVYDKNFVSSQDSVYQEWTKRSPLFMEQCQDCPALGICGGGCPLNADRTKGSIFELDERFCVHAKTVLEWLIWDLYDSAKESKQ
jgi:uncharacterized protein